MTDELKDAVENQKRQAQDLALVWQAAEEAFRSWAGPMQSSAESADSLAGSLQGLGQTMTTVKATAQFLHELGWTAQAYLNVAEAAAAQTPASGEVRQRLARATDMVATVRGLDDALRPLLQWTDEDSDIGESGSGSGSKSESGNGSRTQSRTQSRTEGRNGSRNENRNESRGGNRQQGRQQNHCSSVNG